MDDPPTPDSLDWTPQQALQKAVDFFNGTKASASESVIPDGVLILFHYQDGPVGRTGPKRLYFNAGMTSTDIMALCNYTNLRTAQEMLHDLDEDP
jgi:hypothetical protein